MSPLDPATEARVRNSFGKQQAMVELGARLETVGRGEATIVLPFSPRWTQQHGFIHGGAIGMIADSACGYAALSMMPDNTAVLTTEYKLHFLSPAIGEAFIAVGRVVRPGKRLLVCLGEVFAEGKSGRKQIALMTASMMAVESEGLRD